VSRDRRGEAASGHAQALLARLSANPDADEAGDASLLPASLSLAPLGQLMFLAAALPVIAWIRRTCFAFSAWAWRVPAYGIGGIAAFWTIERVAAFWP
jgi:hypothetical protein